MKETYEELRTRQQKAIESFPCFFAFNQRQFNEGMKELGVKSAKELYQGIGGMFYRKTDSKTLMDLLDSNTEEMLNALKDDDFLYDAFRYELSNHEYCITFDPTDALEAIGLTKKEVIADDRMTDIFARARKDYMKSVSE